jgi:hypothetical protein
LIWIPQQLWAPLEKREGLWTICLHTNTAPDALVRQMEAFLRQHAAQFTSVDRVLAEIPLNGLSLNESLHETAALLRFRSKQSLKRLSRK